MTKLKVTVEFNRDDDDGAGAEVVLDGDGFTVQVGTRLRGADTALVSAIETQIGAYLAVQDNGRDARNHHTG